MPGEVNDGRIGGAGIEQARCSIGVSLASRRQSETNLAGHARPRFRHVDSRRLMPDMNQLDAGVLHGVEKRHDVISGEGKQL